MMMMIFGHDRLPPQVGNPSTVFQFFKKNTKYLFCLLSEQEYVIRYLKLLFPETMA